MMPVKLSDEQWERICHHFPDQAGRKGRLKRPPVPTRRVFEAVLWILYTGAQWSLLPQCYPDYEAVRGRHQTWVRTGVLARALEDLAAEARQGQDLFDGTDAYVDASLSDGGGSEAGGTKAGRGMEIMATVDRRGLPLSLTTHPARPRGATRVRLSLDLAFARMRQRT